MNSSNPDRKSDRPISKLDFPSYEHLIGASLQEARRKLGLTQSNLAKEIGTSAQQIKKYEHGENRLSLSKTLLCACVMNLPVSVFYEKAFKQLRKDMEEMKG